MSSGLWKPRPLEPLERSIVFDAAVGLTAAESAERRGLSMYQVYEVQRTLKRLYGAYSLPHLSALAVAHGEITPDEILRRKERPCTT